MKQSRQSEKGSAIFYVLLAVALFVALNFTVSNIMRGGDGSNIQDEVSKMTAGEILDYGRRLQQSVKTLRINGCTDDNISFANNILAGYEYGSPPPDTCKVFHPDGGQNFYVAPLENWLDPTMSGQANYGEWIITGASCIEDVGTGGSNCDSDGLTTNSELIAFMPYITKTICIAINESLGITSNGAPPPEDVTGAWGAKFTGTYADGTILEVGAPHRVGCFQNGDGPAGSYHFFQVLLAR